MTTEDLFRNVVRGHKIVIALLTLLPIVVMAALVSTQPPQWTASVRIQVGSEAPTSATQAAGLSSRVFAIATTPDLLTKSMRAAGVTDSVHEVTKRVDAERVGESPVVRLSVTGGNAHRTGRLVSSLAGLVDGFMNHGDRAHFDEVLAGVDARIKDAQNTHARLLDRLAATLNLNSRANLKISLRQVEAQMTDLNNQRADLLVSDTNREQTVVIDGSHPDVSRVPSGLLPKLALAGIFGLLLGLSAAAGLELARPRIRGSRAVARDLAVPVIGTGDQPPSVLASSLALAARRRGAETVVLVAADLSSHQAVLRLLSSFGRIAQPPAHRPAAAPEPVAQSARGYRTETQPGRPEGERAGQMPAVAEDPMEHAFGNVRILGLGDVRPHDELSAGAVVVTPRVLTRADLDQLRDLLDVVRWPVLGIVDGASLSTGSAR